MRVLTILQARMSSSRLPGKVMLPVLGRPMIGHQLERIKRAKLISELVVATSSEPSDDELVNYLQKLKVPVFRGKLDDVLDRFFQAANEHPAEHIVRLTGDCPLIDPEVIDQLINLHLDQAADYTSNCLEPTYPDGLDAEVMKMSALQAAWKEATEPKDREHVTPYVYRNQGRFKISLLKNEKDLSALRWTVDEKEDYDLVCKIFEALYPKKPEFGMEDVLEFLESKPDLKNINSHHERNAGA